MASDNDSVSGKTLNVWIDPAYLECLKVLELFTGKEPLEFVNTHVESGIKAVLDDVSGSFSVYMEEINKRLDGGLRE